MTDLTKPRLCWMCCAHLDITITKSHRRVSDNRTSFHLINRI
ncbi:hypothetical protein UUU_07270 [Klebsiella pneumoniae subsp. pneumoniae DSM 30104 = JCM 1662 = NBRC 14940]|nr:hypothetical protein UUU_07270 [Klebsiella pneumoniae subsp. pneumoniae DSM 30104 = JCM 1662 = NBRC 14940]